VLCCQGAGATYASSCEDIGETDSIEYIGRYVYTQQSQYIPHSTVWGFKAIS
jgi:hypothetical protein